MRDRWVLGAVLLASLLGVDLAEPQTTTPRKRAPSPPSAPSTARPPTPPTAPPAASTTTGQKPVTVEAEKLESFQKEGLVIFTGNVVATQDNSTQWADRMEVYLDANGDRVVRTISTGNVKMLTRDCKMGTAKRAEYYDAEQRVLLIGDARVWQEDNVVTGERITIFLAEDRSVVEAGKEGRVTGKFYQKKEGQPKRPPGSPCP